MHFVFLLLLLQAGLLLFGHRNLMMKMVVHTMTARSHLIIHLYVCVFVCLSVFVSVRLSMYPRVSLWVPARDHVLPSVPGSRTIHKCSLHG